MNAHLSVCRDAPLMQARTFGTAAIFSLQELFPLLTLVAESEGRF